MEFVRIRALIFVVCELQGLRRKLRWTSSERGAFEVPGRLERYLNMLEMRYSICNDHYICSHMPLQACRGGPTLIKSSIWVDFSKPRDSRSCMQL